VQHDFHAPVGSYLPKRATPTTQDTAAAILGDFNFAMKDLLESFGADCSISLHRGMMGMTASISNRSRNKVQKLNDGYKAVRHASRAYCDQVLADVRDQLVHGVLLPDAQPQNEVPQTVADELPDKHDESPSEIANMSMKITEFELKLSMNSICLEQVWKLNGERIAALEQTVQDLAQQRGMTDEVPSEDMSCMDPGVPDSDMETKLDETENTAAPPAAAELSVVFKERFLDDLKQATGTVGSFFGLLLWMGPGLWCFGLISTRLSIVGLGVWYLGLISIAETDLTEEKMHERITNGIEIRC